MQLLILQHQALGMSPLPLQAASALSAVFQFFVRDLVGMLGGIIFASLAGGNFDSNAKQWRLFADVTNNIGAWLSWRLGRWCLLSSCSYCKTTCISTLQVIPARSP